MATSKIRNIESQYHKLLKASGSGDTTKTLTFSESGSSVFALLYGRVGYDSSKKYFGILSHASSGQASVAKVYGTEDVTVSCSGDVVSVTMGEYGQLHALCYTPIS